MSTRLAVSYPIAPRGLATSFTESELPPEFALKFRNRFINAAGGAEKRQGMQQRGNTISGTPKLTGLHNLILADGTEKEFVSGEGNIYLFDGTDWNQVYTGWDSDARIRSVQMDDRLIFFNGVDRNIYTFDGSVFKELRAVIIRGINAGAVSALGTDDGDVSNWITGTDVVTNDIVFNITRGGAGVVTALSTANVTHTSIASTGTGIGITNAGDNQAGDQYEIIDSVELNIIPTDAGVDDNLATTGTGTNATTIAVSGVNFLNTEIKVGDFIRNTTRTALTQVSAVATALTVASVRSQTAGDSVIFLKSAMPIATNGHVHFGRLYLSDTRDKRKVRISGASDAEDFTTDAATLDSNTFKFGENQPTGDTVQDMATFQRFFAIAGQKNLYLYQGTNPVADTSADTSDFAIIGTFPQGVVSPDSLVSIGNELVFLTHDGIQTTSLVGDASTLGRANISESLKTTIRDLLGKTPTEDIQSFHYPQRSWYCLKIGSQIYVFNYTAFFGQDELSARKGGTLSAQNGSWSLFDGKFARQNAYLVLQNSTLICAGAGGKVYTFDVDGVYDDDGEVYTTEYQTGWLTLSEPRQDIRIKTTNYIQPIIEAGANISYTIRAEGMFDVESTDTVTIDVSGGSNPIGVATIPFEIGGSPIQEIKYPLRVRGRQIRLTFTTQDAQGPDTISRYTLHANMHGRR